MAATPILVRGGTLKVAWGVTTAEDWSCFVTGFDLTPTTDMVDTGTLCNPDAQLPGRTTWDCSVDYLFCDDFYDALTGHEGEVGHLEYHPDPAGANSVKVDVMFSAIPFGRFAVGERVEGTLDLAVQNTPAWSAVTP